MPTIAWNTRRVGRAVRPVPVLVGLGAASVVVLAVRAVHARVTPATPIDDAWVNAVGLGVATLGLLYSLAMRPRARLAPAVATAGGASLALLSVAVWANLGTVQVPYHRWEQFHYFLGARYFPELGYTEPYRCTVVAATGPLRRSPVPAPHLPPL